MRGGLFQEGLCSVMDSAKENFGGAREVARRVLRRVRRDQAYANLTLSGELERAKLDQRERGLATELVYGVLRHRRRLDHCIARQSDIPLSKVEDDLLDAIRVAAYQILLLERIPAHAAVNDAVEAVKLGRGVRPAGYANAVLRKIAATPGTSELDKDLPDDPVLSLAVSGSLPTWLAKRWYRRFGSDEAADLARSMLERAPLTARANTLRAPLEEVKSRLEGEGAEVTPGRHGGAALNLEGLADPFRSPSYLEGLWTAQDEAAQLAARLLDVRPGMTVLDACAGVGGKATYLAALMQNEGEILCMDQSERKLELLREHCLRLGVTCCQPHHQDLREPDALKGIMVDRVLVDAPCSGLGVLRRHPELKWRPERPDLQGLTALQRELLMRAAGALRPEGVLVYAVCTTTEEEGPAQAGWLRRVLPGMRLRAPEEGPLAGLAIDGGELTVWPHRHGCDGFYMARFVKAF